MPVGYFQDYGNFNSGLTNRSIINIFEYLKISFTLKHDEKLNLES